VAGLLRERSLLLLPGSNRDLVRQLTKAGQLAGWKVLDGGSWEQACLLQQQDPCDVVLIDDASSGESTLEQMDERSLFQQIPVVVLADRPASVVQISPEAAVQHWLPRQLIAAQPRMLAVVLHQAAHLSDLQRELRAREAALRDCQRQVDRLVELMSPDVTPGSQGNWFTHRHMMERLYEEVTRSQRHGDALTMVLGEMTDSSRQPVKELEPANLATWTASQVGRNKRRCDIAGQYGPHGFILLLPHTCNRGGTDCCRRLRPLLENPLELPLGARGPLQVRFGIASYSPDTASVKSLLVQAEERLEHARQVEAEGFVL
jgi:hypothetical protein